VIGRLIVKNRDIHPIVKHQHPVGAMAEVTPAIARGLNAQLIADMELDAVFH